MPGTNPAPRPGTGSVQRVARLLLAGLAVSLLPAGASAQSGEDELNEGVLLAAAPAPGTSSASVTISGQLQQGRTETRGYSVDGVWARMSTSSTLYRLEARLSRADFESPQTDGRVTVEDMQTVAASVVKPISGPFSVLGEVSWKRDAPLGLDRRLLAQAGVGVTLTGPGPLLFNAGPVFGVGRQDNAVAEGDAIVNIGGVSTLQWKVSPTFGVQSSFSGYQDLEDDEDYRVEFQLSGTAQVTSRIGLKTSFRWDREGIHPAGQADFTRVLEIGATIALVGN